MAPGWRQQGLALAQFGLGDKKDSDQALAGLITNFHRDMAFQIAEVYAFRGEIDQAFAWLERAYRQRDAGLSGVKNDPLLKTIDRDARYSTLLKKMHLPV